MRPEVVRDISKSVLRKSRLHKLHAFMENTVGTEMRVKRFRLLEIIAARVIRKRKIEEKVRSFALRVDEAIRKAIDCQQGEAKRSYCGFATVLISIIIIFLLVGVFILVFVLRVIAFHKAYVAMLWRLCIFSKFCKGRSVLMLVTLLEKVWS